MTKKIWNKGFFIEDSNIGTRGRVDKGSFIPSPRFGIQLKSCYRPEKQN